MFCHLNVRTGSRGTGQSAAAKYDYISRAAKYERARPDEVLHLESGCMPSFAEADPRAYWEAADEHERSNGRLFRSMTAALPNELGTARQIKLARQYAEHVTGGDLPYTLAIHAGRSADGPDNPHLHLVFSERINDGINRPADRWFRRAATKDRDPGDGGAKKTRRTMPKDWLTRTRADWAAMASRALADVGSADRVDHRRLAVQRVQAMMMGDTAAAAALDRPPQTHVGPVATHRPEAAPARAKTVDAERAEASRTAALALDVETATAKLDDLRTALDAAEATAVAAAPRDGLRDAGERIQAPPQPHHRLADLAAETRDRQDLAAVPARTWRQAEAATEPIRAPSEPGVPFEALQAEAERRDRERQRRRQERAAARAAAAAKERERAEAENIRLAFDEATMLHREPARAPGRRIEADHRGVDWTAVENSLRKQQAAHTDRYAETRNIGHGVSLPIGNGRAFVEEHLAQAARASAPPIPRPNRLAAAVRAAVDAIQQAADRLIEGLLGRLFPGRGGSPKAEIRTAAPPPTRPPADARPPDQEQMPAARPDAAPTGRHVGDAPESATAPAVPASTKLSREPAPAASPYDDDIAIEPPSNEYGNRPAGPDQGRGRRPRGP